MDQSPDHRGVNLEEALRLLRQTGHADPVAEGLQGAALLQRVLDELCQLSLRDGLTGLPNRRHFNLVLERELDRVARTGESAAVLILDIDRFKHVNDTYGHLAGDRVLQAVAAALLTGLRPMDLAARTGGEEFSIVLPNILPGTARNIAERLRERVCATAVAVGDDIDLRVTASVGGALAPGWQQVDAERLLAQADRQLYLAKEGGRDQVVMEDAVSSAVTAPERDMLLAAPRARKP